VRAVFSKEFEFELVEKEQRYNEISLRLGSAFRARVASQTREIIKWRGGDRVGPHGFPCRRTKPFPFYIYYKVIGDTIHFLGIIHERRHPDFLKGRLKAKAK
jgi:hypothetical protein